MNKTTWMAAIACLTLAATAIPTASATEADTNNPLRELIDRTINDTCNGTVDPVCWECDEETGECTRCMFFANPVDDGRCLLGSPLFRAAT